MFLVAIKVIHDDHDDDHYCYHLFIKIKWDDDDDGNDDERWDGNVKIVDEDKLNSTIDQ